jgi:hypothetical protein
MMEAKRVLLLSLSGIGLLARAVTLHRNTVPASCECLSWQDAFTNYAANCALIGNWACDQFFMKLPNETMCINEFPFSPNARQWCYVAPACMRSHDLLWAGAHSDPQVRYKWCWADAQSDQDIEPGLVRLGDKSPLQLSDWAAANDLDISMAVHWAYPVMRGQMKLTTIVLDFFNISRPENSPRLAFRPKRSSSYHEYATRLYLSQQLLEERRNSSIPTLIPSVNGRPPFGLMDGSELYWLNYRQEQDPRVRVGQDSNPDTQRSWGGLLADTGLAVNTIVRCVAGCDEVVDPWVTPFNTFAQAPTGPLWPVMQSAWTMQWPNR